MMKTTFFTDEDWRTCRRELKAIVSVSALKRILLNKARLMASIAWTAFDFTPVDKAWRFNDREFWRRLGLMVIESDLTNSGGYREVDNMRLVFVRRSEHRWRQRFTAAHEVAHLLLDDAHNEKTFLNAKEEEQLCDDFASELLIPQHLLCKQLDADESGILSPQVITLMCRRFRVNLQPMLIALAQSGRFQNSVALVARRRGHPRRPNEVDYRVDSCPFRSHFFIPSDQRLRSLGLDTVVEWAAGENPGSVGSGVQRLSIPLWKRGQGTGYGVGEASWQAQTLAGQALLLVLDLSKLKLRWQVQNRKQKH